MNSICQSQDYERDESEDIRLRVGGSNKCYDANRNVPYDASLSLESPGKV